MDMYTLLQPFLLHFLFLQLFQLLDTFNAGRVSMPVTSSQPFTSESFVSTFLNSVLMKGGEKNEIITYGSI